MKHQAPQFELPGVESVFNLAAETIREADENPIAKPDFTADMFENIGENHGLKIIELEKNGLVLSMPNN